MSEEAEAAFRAFAEAMRAIAHEPGGPPAAPPSTPEEILSTTLPGGLVERLLTQEELGQMIEREMPTRPGSLPGSADPPPEGVRVVVGKHGPYYIDTDSGTVLGHCISTVRGYRPDEKALLIEALAAKHLIDFDEGLFLSVADDEDMDTRRPRPR